MRRTLASRLEKLERRSRLFLFTAITSLAACAVAVGCGLDDSAVTQIGTDDAGDATVGSDAAPKPSDSGVDAHACTPETCNSFPSICRSGLDNGCGSTIDCSAACPNGQACILDSGTCDGPPVCRDAGAPGGNCGTIVNPGNGLDASCGSCSDNFFCFTNVCTCLSGAVCGTQCCSAGSTDCAVAPNTCCHLKTCTGDYPLQCGTALDDGCGGTLNCSGFCGSETCATNTGLCCGNTVCSGTCCTPGQVCNGTNCCSRDLTSVTCGGGGGKCGVVNDNCGVPTNCPGPGTACVNGNECFGASCTCGTATCSGGQTCSIGGDAGTGQCN